MARVEIQEVVLKARSNGTLTPAAGASVRVLIRSSQTLATVYAGETTSSTVTNPVVSDTDGRIEGWVTEGSYDLLVSGTGVSSYTQPFEAISAQGTIVGPAGPAGPTGPTGATGALGPAGAGQGVDVWASQGSPGSVTDWGAVVNTLLTAGNRYLYFGPHDFPFTTRIDMGRVSGDTPAVTFLGAGGRVYPYVRNSTYVPPTRLIWKNGAGSGRAIGWFGDSPRLINLAVVYDHATYDGDLIMGYLSPTGPQTAVGLISGCTIGAKNWTQMTARSLVNFDGSNFSILEDTTLIGAQDAIRGYEGFLSDNITVENVSFYNCSKSYICNMGRNWALKRLLFGGGSYGDHEPPKIITGDVAMPGGQFVDVTMEDLWAWDFNTNVLMIDQPSNQRWLIDAKHLFSFGGSHVKFNGPGSVVINDFHPTGVFASGDPSPIDLGDFTVGLKDYVEIKNVQVQINPGGPAMIANRAGHRKVTLKGFGAFERARTVLEGHEYADYTAGRPPTIAGIGGVDARLDRSSTDTAGIITINGAAAAGNLCTLTFGDAYEPDGSQSYAGAYRRLQILVTPIELPSCTLAAAATMGLVIAKLADDQLSAFILKSQNAFPATFPDQIAAFQYRVLSLPTAPS